MPRGRHRSTKPDTYTLPLVETWEQARTRYAKPRRWARLTRWLHHA